MRIAIDARLNAYRQGGISQYTRQLLSALAEVSQTDEFISLQHRDQLRPLAIAPNVIRRTALTPPHHRYEQWTLPLEVMLARPNVLHCPDFIAPVRRPCPAVVTIHDLAFMHYPEILDDAANAFYGQVKTNAPRADAIIAVSEATRQDVAQFLDIPIEQIDVIYEAAAPLYTPIELRAGEARVLNSTPVEADTFMLFVSTLEPRKNLPTLLRALRICIDRNPAAGYRLVVVGRRGWRDEAIFTAVRDLRLGEHVLFAGSVGQYDLRWLYNACRLYINPSLYEGFGLPLLEAMACGAPCLAAATSSLPEIGGRAAIYVPPLDAEQWADEIEALWDDEGRRAELGRLGMARAQRFSWLRAARETLKVYQRAAERIVPAPTLRTAPMPAELVDDPLSDLPAARRTAPSPGGPRACLRCGAEMHPGKLQRQLGVHTSDAGAPDQVLAPRMWACGACGHVELVVDWAVPILPERPPAAPALAALNGASDAALFETAIADEPAEPQAALATEDDSSDAALFEPAEADEPAEPAAAPALATKDDASDAALFEPAEADEPAEPQAALATEDDASDAALFEPAEADEPAEPQAAPALATKDDASDAALFEPAEPSKADEPQAALTPEDDASDAALFEPAEADEPAEPQAALASEDDASDAALFEPAEATEPQATLTPEEDASDAALFEPAEAAEPQAAPTLAPVLPEPAARHVAAEPEAAQAGMAEATVGERLALEESPNGKLAHGHANGVEPKPKSRGARRGTTASADAPEPPKRRQSRSKRK